MEALHLRMHEINQLLLTNSLLLKRKVERRRVRLLIQPSERLKVGRRQGFGGARSCGGVKGK